MTDELLSRIADALDRLAPAPPPPADLSAAPAYIWDGATIQPVAAFAPVPYELLTGIDAQKSQLLENTRRLSSGHAAHDVLLWGRSEEHTSELQSLMRISYAVFCLKKKHKKETQ